MSSPALSLAVRQGLRYAVAFFRQSPELWGNVWLAFILCQCLPHGTRPEAALSEVRRAIGLEDVAGNLTAWQRATPMHEALAALGALCAESHHTTEVQHVG